MTLPRKPLAVVFDLDGTLIDSEALVREAHFAACDRLGYAMSDAQFLSLVGLHREANDAQLKGFYGDDFPLEDFIAATRAHVGDRVAPLKPGALELMDALDDMVLPYGLATSSPAVGGSPLRRARPFKPFPCDRHAFGLPRRKAPSGALPEGGCGAGFRADACAGVGGLSRRRAVRARCRLHDSDDPRSAACW